MRNEHLERRRLWLLGAAVLTLGALLATAPFVGPAGAQDTPSGPAGEDAAGPQPETPAADAAGGEAADGEDGEEGSAAAPAGADGQEGRLNLFELIYKGGMLMIPIALMSILVVAMVIERFIALRRRKVMPPELVDELGRLSGTPGGFDPRQAYRICQAHPSSAATVVRAMVLKVGRPHAEVEHAVAEASEREASRLYANVQWLTLAAAVAPLLGLFGTVWGMIQAFFDLTLLQPGQNKGDVLAAGIYVALVTTLGGLAVAIPAAIFAHWFEGRIQSWFHQIDEMLFNLLPQIERYEGRLRVSQQSLAGGDADAKRTGADESGQKKPVAAK